MRFICRYFLLFCLFFISKSFGQIAGQVQSENGKPISGARVTVWKSENKTDFLDYTFSDSNGNFKIKSQSSTFDLFIEVTALNFSTSSLKHTNANNPLKVVLLSKEIILDEIEIINKPAVIVQNDTVFYNPAKFLDGTEKKSRGFD